MIGTVRKHQTWLWAIIIAIVILSFVVFFSPTANMDLGQRGYDLGSINGKPISKEQFLDAREEMELFYRIRFGEWPREEVMRMMGMDLDRETYTRLLLTEKVKDLNIQVTPEATAQFITDMFSQGDGRGISLETYQRFVKEQLEPRGLTAEDFERFAAHQVAQQHLMNVYGASGRLVTPEEAKAAYQRDNESFIAEAAFFNSSNFLSTVNVTDDALTRYFNLNKAKYRIPNKVQVDYVKFAITNFYAQADQEISKMTNLTMQLEQVYFQRGGTNFYRDEKTGKGLSFDEAKPQIQSQLRDFYASNEARKKAYDFLTALDAYVAKNPDDKAAMAKVAAEQKVSVTQTPPFDQQANPTQLKLPPAFVQQAFRLDDSQRFSTEPIVNEDGAYVLWLNKTIEGRIPELAEVKKQVTDDFKESEALKAARSAGEKFASEAAAKLKEGKSFQAVAIEHKVKPVTLPAFTPSTRSLPEVSDRISLDRLQNAANRLAPGQASDFLATEQGGAVIFLREKKPVDPAKMDKELAEFTNRLRDQRQFAAFNDWLQKLGDEMRLQLPARATESAQK